MNAHGPGIDFARAAVALGFFGIPIVWIVAYYCHATFKAWQETALKRDMVARGYTAEEIIAVVKARKGKKSDTPPLPDVPPAKPIEQPAHVR